MKHAVLITALLFAMVPAGAAVAQDRTVTPKTTTEGARAVTDAVSGAARDAAKAGETKDSADMEKKAGEAGDAAKTKMKDTMK